MVPEVAPLIGVTLLALSPHPDDVVFSCGAHLAALAAAGKRVEVATVFSADNGGAPLAPFAREFHAAAGLPEDGAAEVRRQEDALALALLGLEPRYLGFVDAAYRYDEGGRPLVSREADLFSAAEDSRLAHDVGLGLGNLCAELEPELLLAPLALGGHVDHRLVHRAAAAAGVPILFYEDLPYAADPVAANRHPAATLDLEPVVHPAPAAAWQLKLRAVMAYRSQAQVLTAEGRGLRSQLTAHAEQLGDGTPAERLWKPTPSP